MGFIQQFKSLPVSTKRLLGLGLVLALAIALPLFIWAIITQRFELREKAEVQRFAVSTDGEPSMGPSDAPVTIAEFADLQCAFCKQFAENTLPQILSVYGSYVRFVFKDFPLTEIHPLAEKAAVATQCSFAQNKFWEMHDLIFSNQDSLTEENFATFSAQLDLDQDAFNTCYQDQTPLTEVQGDFSEGQALLVTGTPTFFINGIRLEGNQPFENFQTLINSELLLKDDLRFDTSFTTISFISTDQSPNVSISPDKLVEGKTYVANVAYRLQNTIKFPDLTSETVTVSLAINGEGAGSKDISYSLISGQTNGADDSISATFTAKGNSTSIALAVDGQNAFAETDENNNTADYSFSSGIGGPQETPTPSPQPAGEPNFCGGTCGSNYNCQGNYFCFEGFCRNPLCKTDADCDCITPTPKPTTKPKTTKKPVSSQEIIFLSPEPILSPRPTPTFKPTPTSTPPSQEESKPNLSFLLYLAGGSFGLAVLLLIAKALTKK